MKDGVTSINLAKGWTYYEKMPLYDGLKSLEKIAMAGIDVFKREPAVDNRLLDLDNITVTPHLGANTRESPEKYSWYSLQRVRFECKRYPHTQMP